MSIYNPRPRYGLRDLTGGLKESLKTIKYITKKEFNEKLIDYDFYGIDERVNQILFIKKNDHDNPLWLFIEI